MMLLFLVFLLVASASASDYLRERSKRETSEEYDRILCHFGEMNFSSSINPEKYYYSCNQPEEYALRKRCPVNMKYVSAPENKCKMVHVEGGEQIRSPELMAIQDKSSDDSFVKPIFIDQDTVSKDVVLGGLYNGKTDQYYISKRLWKAKTIEAEKSVFNKKSSETKFGYGRIGTEKMDKMDIRGSLQLSILGGLASVEGSAKFFRETTVYENEEVVNMYYKGTTKTEVIPAHTKPELLIYCSDKAVTHVVTSVTYGLNAYFQYTTKKQESSKEETLKGDVTASFKKFVLSITGSAQIDMQERKKYLQENTNVVFRGDILLKEMPTNYEKAIKAYKTVTSLLPEKPDEAQIVSARLSPISDFCKDVHRKLYEINQKVMKTLLSVFSEIEKLKIRIDALLRKPIITQFSSLRNNLDKYSEGLLEHQSIFTNELSIILPKIRGGDGREDLLMKLYTSHSKSAFSKINSQNFIEARLREINALEVLLSVINTEADNVVKVDYIKAIDVHAGLKVDRHLTLNLNIMDPNVTERFLKNRIGSEVKPWYNNKTLNEKIRSLLKPFKEFARVNKHKKGELAYLIQVNKKQASKMNSEISLFESMKNSEFLLPKTPGSLVTKSVFHDSIIFITGKAQENKWIKKYQITYWKVIGDVTLTKTFDISNMLFEIKGLDPITLYRFTLQYYTDYGLSPESQAIDVVTKPSSQPTNLQLMRQAETSLTVEWNKPLNIGKINGKEISISYEVDIRDVANGKIMRLHKNISATRFEFSRLKSASKYNITVAAGFFPANETKAIVSESTSKIFYTSPDRPQLTTIGQPSLTSVRLRWSIPKTADGDRIEKYQVSYTMLNVHGNATLQGRKNKLIYTTNVTTTVADLAQGTYYMFQVKAITSYASSLYSNAVTEKTKFDQTELDKLKLDIKSQILASTDAKLIKLQSDIKNQMSSSTDAKLSKLQSDIKNQTSSSTDAKLSKLQSNIKNQMSSSTDYKLKYLKSDIERKSERELKKVNSEMSSLKSKISILEKSFYNFLSAFAFCHMEVGEGKDRSGSSSNEISLGKISIYSCKSECWKKRSSNSRIKGFSYKIESEYCYCKLDMTGTDHDPNYVTCVF